MTVSFHCISQQFISFDRYVYHIRLNTKNFSFGMCMYISIRIRMCQSMYICVYRLMYTCLH